MKSALFLLVSTLLSCLLFCHKTNAFVATVAPSPQSAISSTNTIATASTGSGILSCSSPVTARTFAWDTSTTTAKKYRSGNTSTSALFAKKKKSKNKQQQQQSGFAWAASFTLYPFESATLRDLASATCASYEGRTGKPLAEELRKSSDIPKTLWDAPVACVIVGKEQEQERGENENENSTGGSNRHGNGNGNGSIIMYANVAALETVGLQPGQFEQLIAMKDPGSGEWKVSEKVTKVIDLPCSMNGDKAYESGYQKKIIKGGTPSVSTSTPAETETDLVDINTSIRIENAQRWKIEKNALVDGKFVTESLGVAYAWNSWWEGDDTLCRPGGVREVDSKLKISEKQEKVNAQGEKIKAQGEIIRELKEVQGFGNKDPEVADAVKELLRLKALLEELVSD